MQAVSLLQQGKQKKTKQKAQNTLEKKLPSTITMSVTYAENSLWCHILINMKKLIKADAFQSVIPGPEKITCLFKLGGNKWD